MQNFFFFFTPIFYLFLQLETMNLEYKLELHVIVSCEEFV